MNIPCSIESFTPSLPKQVPVFLISTFLVPHLSSKGAKRFPKVATKKKNEGKKGPGIRNDNRFHTIRTESSNLLSVLDELDFDALPDSRVGLLGLNTDLFEDDTLGVRGATERRGLEGGSEKTLLVSQIGPFAITAMVAQLAGRVETTRLALSHDCR